MHNVPAHTRAALSRFVESGLKPGDFLYSVLCGNLFEAIRRADHDNTAAIVHVVNLVEQQPSCCYGSKDRVDAWIKKGGLRGLEERQE